MDEIGQTITKLRKRKGLNQEELASAAGVSQATISRLEKQEQAASIKTLAKIAKALEVGLSELVPVETLNNGGGSEDTFFAFCENPFCSRNKMKLNDQKQPIVYWESWQPYSMTAWADVNFCRLCGSDLVKECPSCGKTLLEKGARFCTRCGKKITTRPTDEDWVAIRAQLAPDDDGGFDDDIPF